MLFAIFLVSALVLEGILWHEARGDERRAGKAGPRSENEQQMTTDLAALARSLDSRGRGSEPESALVESNLRHSKKDS